MVVGMPNVGKSSIINLMRTSMNSGYNAITNMENRRRRNASLSKKKDVRMLQKLVQNPD